MLACSELLDRLFRPHHDQRAIKFRKPDVVVPIYREPIVGTFILSAPTSRLSADGARDQVSGGGNEVANQAKFRVAVPDISLFVSRDQMRLCSRDPVLYNSYPSRSRWCKASNVPHAHSILGEPDVPPEVPGDPIGIADRSWNRVLNTCVCVSIEEANAVRIEIRKPDIATGIDCDESRPGIPERLREILDPTPMQLIIFAENARSLCETDRPGFTSWFCNPKYVMRTNQKQYPMDC